MGTIPARPLHPPHTRRQTRMSVHRVHLEQLLGREVHDSAGVRAGRIEEVHAERSGNRCQVTEYVLGEAGLVERLSIPTLSTALLHFLGARKRRASPRAIRVPWRQMD